MQAMQVQSLGQEDPLEKLQPAPEFWPGKFHGQKSLVGYSPWGHKESAMTGELSVHTGSTAPVLGSVVSDTL